MSDDIKLMAKILAAIKVCERERRTDMSLFDAGVLKCDEMTRDALIVSLQKDGYADGFCIIEDIDNQAYPVVMLKNSYPRITIKGIEFIEENEPLKKAIKELKDTALDIAKTKLAGAILTM